MVSHHAWRVYVAGVMMIFARAGLANGSEGLTVILRGQEVSERAPHGEGNVYAPDVHRTAETWQMWYGGQGADGHDRIHLAESSDGLHWVRRGVVVDCGDANHVNDPSVVKFAGKWWMYFTVAAQAEDDEIALATSDDGVRWHLHGVVLTADAGQPWESRKIGRPSVLVDGARLRMWYDGQPKEDAVLQDEVARKTKDVGRAIGCAESTDGVTWVRHGAPVWMQGAGAVHVTKIHNKYLMVYESHGGTRWATSSHGLDWQDQGLLVTRCGDIDGHGHVTPFLWIDSEREQALLFVGAAARPTWNFNSLARVEVPWRTLVGQ